VGAVTIPAGHTLMRASVAAGPADDAGGAWSLTVDDFYAVLERNELQIANELGERTAAIDEDGNVYSHDVLVSGTLQVPLDRVDTGDGVTLETVVGSKPRGIVMDARRVPAVSGITNSEYGLVEGAFDSPPDAADRSYRMNISVQVTTPQDADYSFITAVRYTTDETTPTITSAESDTVRLTVAAPGLANRQPTLRTSYLCPPMIPDTRYRYLLALRNDGPTTVSVVGEVSLWLEDIGPKLPNSGASNDGGGVLGTGGSDPNSTGGTPVVGAKTRFSVKVPITDTHWWEGNLTHRTSDNQYIGYHTGEGNRRAAMFLPASVQTKLAGATVLSARLRLNPWSGGNGKTYRVISHSSASTTNYNAINTTNSYLTKTGINDGTLVWINLAWSQAALQGLQTGAMRGFVVGPGASNDSVYKSSFRGGGHNNRPLLEIIAEK
jgi:hypothetical protein